jgi:hypothetical protein
MVSSKCPTCEGRKFIVGFGGIRKPCNDCKTETKNKATEISKLDKRSKEYRELKKKEG